MQRQLPHRANICKHLHAYDVAHWMNIFLRTLRVVGWEIIFAAKRSRRLGRGYVLIVERSGNFLTVGFTFCSNICSCAHRSRQGDHKKQLFDALCNSATTWYFGRYLSQGWRWGLFQSVHIDYLLNSGTWNRQKWSTIVGQFLNELRVARLKNCCGLVQRWGGARFWWYLACGRDGAQGRSEWRDTSYPNNSALKACHGRCHYDSVIFVFVQRWRKYMHKGDSTL